MPIACLQTNLTDTAACLEVYDRLAYGGTAHAPKPSRDGDPSDRAAVARALREAVGQGKGQGNE